MTSEKGSRKDKNQNIQVFVRLRPLNQRERDIKSFGVVEVAHSREVIVRQAYNSTHTKKFVFDRAFGPNSKQVEVYHDVVSPLIKEVLNGYNCTVFAYGQTGTGKTHTMVGENSANETSWQDDPLAGIIPRSLSQLFDELRMSNTEFNVRVSYLELYNEELFDLLSSSEDNSKLKIYEDPERKGSNHVHGLELVMVYNKNEVYKIMERGQDKKRVAATLMNAQSSRSHTVFSIIVEMKETSREGEELVKIGKLNLVDLAGSENISKAGSDEPGKRERARECVNINQSLLTLGRVITALVERHPHVPYRESKLTRILQESLGGRTKTSIIATISPGHKDLEETLSTLEYASRAKNIQNKPEVNQKMTTKAIMKVYEEENNKLRRDLQAAKDKHGVFISDETYSEMTLKQQEQHREIQELLLRQRALQEELDQRLQMFHLTLEEKEQLRRECEQERADLQRARELLQHTEEKLKSSYVECSEQQYLVRAHFATERALSEQARQLLSAAELGAAHQERLHDAVERRRMLEQANLTVTQAFRNESSQQREELERKLDAFTAALMEDVLVKLQRRLENYSDGAIENNDESRKMLEELSQNVLEALNELELLRERWSSGLSSASEARRNALRADVARLSAALRAALEAAGGEAARAAHDAGSGAECAAAQLAQALRDWCSSISDRVTALRGAQSEFLSALDEGAERRGEDAERRRAERAALLDAREQRLQAVLEQVREESSRRCLALARRLEDAESARLAAERRLEEFVRQETQRLRDHAARTRAEVEEEQRAEEVSAAALAASLAEQLDATRAERELLAERQRAAGARGAAERELRDARRRDLHAECSAALNGVSSCEEAVSRPLLAALADLRARAEAAAAAAQSGVSEALAITADSEQQIDGLAQDLTQELERECQRFATALYSAIESSSVATRGALSAVSARLVRQCERARALRGAGAEHAADGAALARAHRAHAAAALADMAERERVYLAQEYRQYVPSGGTPARQELRVPRALAATSPHARLLARLRAQGTHGPHALAPAPDDDCVLVESDASSSPSSCECSLSDEPAPPAPPAAPPVFRAPAALNDSGNRSLNNSMNHSNTIMKSTSETDIYAMKRQQSAGKENQLQRSASSLKKPSRLPAPRAPPAAAAASHRSPGREAS